ncbi:NMT1/THI5 like protein [Pseudobythopirellula maris]|uniref:NMT1/THI5 like protein n=1 Tax=Pseudobythopirellula maris TaxID=2527991 RepID=A0A5C5ZIE3_9BACT|nr:ABC transporter substrate-binding protein [Pseudobythopirellula maris]TWT86571.1 NMT1/THI5 like protein [Pseudobythopirellula maris]
MPRSLSTACVLLLIFASPALAADRVTVALNWKAQPELGGFYQSVADGTYAAAGLDVTIRPGGPLVNNRPLLAVGRVDFLVGTNLLQAFDAVKQGIPTRVVAAMLQRDPQCLIAHPPSAEGGYDKWEELTRAPLLMAPPGRHSFFLWMESAHGFRREMLRPYNHSLAPFLAHKDWIQQGYATAEPKRVEEELGQEPRVFLLADHGWESYSTTIETRQELIDRRPELVQRFVDATILGWVRYLYGDNAAASRLIQRDNPDMTDGQIAYSLRKTKAWGLVDSGDALTRGVGVLRPERVKAFYEAMVAAGIYRADEIDPLKACTERFVGHGVGVAQRTKLLGEP